VPDDAHIVSDRDFLGAGWSFPPACDPFTRGAVVVSRDEDVAQSLRILLATAPGERVMRPTFGCGLKRMVFEQITDSVVTEIKDLIARAILFFEPRITVDVIEVDASSMIEGELRIRLAYTIRSTNSRANLVFPLYLGNGGGAGTGAPSA